MMLSKNLLLSFLLLYPVSSIVAQPVHGINKQLSVIPQPMSVKKTPGNFIIGKKTRIYIDSNNNSLKKIGEMLSAQLKLETGYDIIVNEKSANSSGNAIILTQNDATDTLGSEGYNLSVHPEKVIIKSLHPAGVFYGMQTLLQLLPVQLEALNKNRWLYSKIG